MQTVPTQEVQTAAPFSLSAGAKANVFQRVCAALFEPVDISFLVFFRILFGGIMLWEVYRYFSYGWISRYYVEPVVNFTYYGFSWVKPWPGRGMYIHFFVLGLAAACVMAGFLYRIATPVFFLAFTYTFLLDQTRYLNHFYLVCLVSFLMCFLPAELAFSVDALLRRKGHNFSWHMKLRTKGGEGVFTVTHPQSGQTWTIKPEDHLESHQVTKMITKPDLILHFAHHLAEEKRREGYDNVEVRARVMVSLNGRQPQLFIDPNVDLAKEEVSLLPARWVVPLTTPLVAPANPGYHSNNSDSE